MAAGTDRGSLYPFVPFNNSTSPVGTTQKNMIPKSSRHGDQGGVGGLGKWASVPSPPHKPIFFPPNGEVRLSNFFWGEIEPPQIWVFRKRAQLRGILISYYELRGRRHRQYFSPNTWQMMFFLNLLHTLIPKIPFSIFFFAEFLVQVTSGARGSVLTGFWVAGQWPFFWGGAGPARGPPLPR